jgi:hypothetical protein
MLYAALKGRSSTAAQAFATFSAACKAAAEKTPLVSEKRPLGLKPAIIPMRYAALKGRSSTAAQAFATFSAACKAAAEKTPLVSEKRPLGLKPAIICDALRGPEGPLFHGRTGVRDFFRSL